MKISSVILVAFCIGLVSCNKSASNNANQTETKELSVNPDTTTSNSRPDTTLVQKVEEPDEIKEAFEKCIEKHTLKYIQKNKTIRKIIKKDEAGEMISSWWSENCSSTKFGKSDDGKVLYIYEEYDCWSYTIYYDSENKEFYVKSVKPDYDVDYNRDHVTKYHVGGGEIPENIKSLMH